MDGVSIIGPNGRARSSVDPSESPQALSGPGPSVCVRFYAELNDSLPVEQRRADIVVRIKGVLSVRRLVSSFGIAEDDVDLILVNGTAVDFEHFLSANDRISVYPVYESFDISAVTLVRGSPLRRPKFVLDCHLGKLAYYLRMFGFDTLYRSDYRDDELIALSAAEQRTILSRDRILIEETRVTRGYRVRETNPKLQVIEVLRRFDLFGSVRPLQRCLRCNSFLAVIERSAVLDRLPEMVRGRYNDFQTCPTCGRVYWKGSHYQRMEQFIAGVLRAANQ